jgi:hypothetical protein
MFFLCTPRSSANKTDRHDITELLLKSGVKHYNPNPNPIILGISRRYRMHNIKCLLNLNLYQQEGLDILFHVR